MEIPRFKAFSPFFFLVSAQPNHLAPGCKILGEQYKSGESAEVLVESADKSIIYCQQCRCKAGKHKCHKIYDCDIQSGACEKSLKIPGQCCPVCGESALNSSCIESLFSEFLLASPS